MSDRLPWMPSDNIDANRVPPRECVKAARDALDKTYAYTEAPLPLIVEALDWLRRACEQMAMAQAVPSHHQVLRSEPVTFTVKPTPPSGPPPDDASSQRAER